jgi:hypothetical protein
MSIPTRSTLAALFATLLLGACSSRNPDSLIGMNVDENAAMMDANASSDANPGPTVNGSDERDASASAGNSHAVQPNSAASARAEGERNMDANEVETDNSVAADQSTANQLGNGEEPPNPDGAPSD